MLETVKGTTAATIAATKPAYTAYPLILSAGTTTEFIVNAPSAIVNSQHLQLRMIFI